jgi:UDP-N-acetylmuramate dehydrogenase
MKVTRDYNLKSLNTFGIEAHAKFFTVVESEEDFNELIKLPEYKENDKLFLGGGSNILLTRDFSGIVILNKIKGISVVKKDENFTWIRAMGGEVWHDLVLFAVERGLWGIENLSFIPGSVGAAPMQNIGAYGAELKNVLESTEALDVDTGEKKVFHGDDCSFGYRDSIFKNVVKGKYFILAITIRLSKAENKNIDYKVLKNYIEENKIAVTHPSHVSDAVTAIRKSKLPDPKLIGNAGSFFKNVFVTPEKFHELSKQYPDIPHFDEGGKIKVPAAWLIEQAGWKGHRRGGAGVHDRQALVLVNHGGATGEDVRQLADEIIASVYEKFGLKITPEVNLI